MHSSHRTDPTMKAAPPTPPTAAPPIDGAEDIEDTDVTEGADDADADAEQEGPDELAEESGIDLTDASELDADNVPADEEHDRVIQAPD